MTQSTSPPKQAPDPIVCSSKPSRRSSRSESDSSIGKRAAFELDVGDPEAPKRGANRRDLAVERTRDDGHPVEAHGKLEVLLTVPPRELERRVRQLHHVRTVLDAEVEATRQVDVQHVEPARTELELPRLDVHDDVVAHLDRPGQARIGDARRAVDLEPDETVVLLENRGDAPASKAQHRARRRSARA